MKNANPYYDEANYSTSHNCQRCGVAYEARRRGFDVQAQLKQVKAEDDLYAKGKWRKVFGHVVKTNLIVNPITDKHYKQINDYTERVRYTKGKLQKQMQQYGRGARGIVGVYWQNGSNEGHVFIAQYYYGSVKYNDPQNAMSDCAYYFQTVQWQGMELVRIDDKPFTEFIRECVQ